MTTLKIGHTIITTEKGVMVGNAFKELPGFLQTYTYGGEVLLFEFNGKIMQVTRADTYEDLCQRFDALWAL